MKRRLIVGLLVAILAFSLSSCITKSESTQPVKDQIVKEIYNNNMYEFIDPDTGVHYWIYSHCAGSAGMGGMTPRLNSDGSIMVD